MESSLANGNAALVAASIPAESGNPFTRIKLLLSRCFAARAPGPWQAGYNDFYTGVRHNPYPAGTSAHQEWEHGNKAGSDDFEW